MSTAKSPVLLVILDGWGHREAIQDNAIANASTPTWEKLWNEQPHALISTSGMDVGLPEGQMGNSEVGHMSLGAGRIVYQNISKIDKSIAEGDFFKNTTYLKAIDKAVAKDKAVHILGLLSPGGVHSHQNHIFAMIKMAKERGAKKIYVHPILDGRDTPPRSAEAYLEELDKNCADNGAQIASLIGRYYAMDRDNRWDRVEQAYNLYTLGESAFSASSAAEALSLAYARDENDEFVQATQLVEEAKISDDDATSELTVPEKSLVLLSIQILTDLRVKLALLFQASS
jgi:2,3-bisphosphoglycerate-independent phosphoglycerate mutase